MAITFVADGGYASGGSGNVVLTKPAGLAVGDALLAFVAVQSTTSGTGTITPPGGWTNAGDTGYSNDTNATPGYNRLYLFTKIAAAGEPSTYTFTYAGATAVGADGNVRAYRGTAGTTGSLINTFKTAVVNAGANPLSIICPAFSETFISGEWVVYCAIDDFNPGFTSASPLTLLHTLSNAGIFNAFEIGDAVPASSPAAETINWASAGGGAGGSSNIIGVSLVPAALGSTNILHAHPLLYDRRGAASDLIIGTAPWRIAAISGLRGLPFWNDHRAPYSQLINPNAPFTAASDPKYLAQTTAQIALPFLRNDHRSATAIYDRRQAVFDYSTTGTDPRRINAVSGLIGLPFWNDHRAPYSGFSKAADFIGGNDPWLIDAVNLPFWNDHRAPYNSFYASAGFAHQSDPNYLAAVSALLGLPFWNDHRAPYSSRYACSDFFHQSDPKYLAQISGLTGLPFWNDHRAAYSGGANPNASFIGASDPKYLAQVFGLRGQPFSNDHRAPYSSLGKSSDFVAGTNPRLIDAINLPFSGDFWPTYNPNIAVPGLSIGSPYALLAQVVQVLPFAGSFWAPYSSMPNSGAAFIQTPTLWQLAAVSGLLGLPFANDHRAAVYDRRQAAYDYINGTDPYQLDAVRGLLGLPFSNDHRAGYSGLKTAADWINGTEAYQLDLVNPLVGLPFANDHRAPFGARQAAPDFVLGTQTWRLDAISGYLGQPFSPDYIIQAATNAAAKDFIAGTQPWQLAAVSGELGEPFSNAHPAPYDLRKAAKDHVAGTAPWVLDAVNLPFSGELWPPYNQLAALPGQYSGGLLLLLPPVVPAPFHGLALAPPYDMQRGKETPPQSTDPELFPPAFSGALPFRTDHSAPFDSRADKKAASFYVASDPKYQPVVGFPFWNEHRAPYDQQANKNASFTNASGPQWLAQVNGLKGLPFWNDHRAAYNQFWNTNASFVQSSGPQWLAQVFGLKGLPFANDHRAAYSQQANTSASFYAASDPKYQPVVSVPFWNDHRASYDRRQAAADFIDFSDPEQLDQVNLPFWNKHEAPFDRRQDASKPEWPTGPIILDQLGIRGEPFQNDHRAPYDKRQAAPDYINGTEAYQLDQVNLPSFQSAQAAAYSRGEDRSPKLVGPIFPVVLDQITGLPFRTQQPAPAYDARASRPADLQPARAPALDQVNVPGQAYQYTPYYRNKAADGYAQPSDPRALDAAAPLPFRTRHDAPYSERRAWQAVNQPVSPTQYPPSVIGFPFWADHRAPYSDRRNPFASFVRGSGPILIPAIYHSVESTLYYPAQAASLQCQSQTASLRYQTEQFVLGR